MLSEQNKQRLKNSEESLLLVKKVLDNLGIDFFITHGGLIGLVRDGHLIPYDTDLDVATFVNPKEIGIEKIKNAFKKEGVYRCWQGPFRPFLQTFGIYLKTPTVSDVEFWIKIPEENKVRTFDAGVWCPLDYFNSYKEIDYLGTKFKIPEKAEELLEWNYGPNWRIPCVLDTWERKRRWLKCDENGEPFRPFQVLDVPPSFYRGAV